MLKPYDLTKPSDLPDLVFKAFGRTLYCSTDHHLNATQTFVRHDVDFRSM